MKRFIKTWPFFLSLFSIGIVLVIVLFITNHTKQRLDPWKAVTPFRAHLDHSAFFSTPIKNPEEVTLKCLSCHKNSGHEMIETVHWQWKDKKNGLGKKNLINNFCIGVQGNWKGCTKCHAGYGWKDEKFDFKNTSKVDCLVCHEWSGQYVKGVGGMPVEKTDLQAVAKSVGYPKRENCGVCHYNGGGGMGVKHGDMDGSLTNPSENLDVHMGRNHLLCIDCHRTKNHQISGRAYSVGIDHEGGFDCIQCHKDHAHKDKRLNAHLASVSCQACHIPTFAKRMPTKTEWDWSMAGDAKRKDDPHHYLKIKGAFVYDANIVPTYKWFNYKVDRYLVGDKISSKEVTNINYPQGNIDDPSAKIWPFKIHDAKQIYDEINNYLLVPITAGEGGYWKEFDWDKAARLSESYSGLKYSGKFNFAKTRMYWPITHMVVPKNKTLSCNDCHGIDQKRMDWKALGYEGDPIDVGGRGGKNENK